MIMVEKMSLQEHELRNARSKKMLLWFAMISMFMTFAGLTSAYVVSASRPDWAENFKLPDAFIISTVVIMISSITFHLAKSATKKGNRGMATAYLMATLALGLAFVYCQFYGFQKIIESGYFFTGAYSSVTTSFVY